MASAMSSPPPQPHLRRLAGAAVTDLPHRAHAALCDTYARQPLTLVRGEGAWVVTDTGARLLDCVGGIAVSVLGHGHPGLTAAIVDQARRLIHTSNLYYTEPQVALAERLVATAFPARVFFSNSGAEANEAAIKVARKWGQRHRGGAHVIVTVTAAFHGRTLGTLAATASARYGDPFLPLPGGFRQVPRVAFVTGRRREQFREVEGWTICADAGPPGFAPRELRRQRGQNAGARSHDLF